MCVFPLQIKHTILIELVIIIMHHFQVNFRIQHSTGADRLKSKYIIFLGSTHFTKTLTSSPILQQRSSECVRFALKHTIACILFRHGVQKHKKNELKHLKTYRNTYKHTQSAMERERARRSEIQLTRACTRFPNTF